MLRLFVWLYMAFLFLPIGIIALFAFHSSPSMSFPFEGFSFQWFTEILSNDRFIDSLKNSLIVAVCTAVITCILGTLAALAMTRLSSLPKALFSGLAFAPIALPGLFLGISLMILFEQFAIYRSLVTVIIAHVLFCLPFFVETVKARVAHFDSDLELAARDLGATATQAFSKVTLPILAPTIIGATILAFALSFDEIIITVFVIGEESTLPFYILSLLRRTVNPTINAASVLALVLTTLTLAIAGAIMGYQRWQATRKRGKR